MSAEEKRSSFLDGLERLVKTLAFLVGVLYAIGLLVANRLLLSLGLSDFASVRPRHIVTGALTVLLVVLAVLPVLIPTLYIRCFGLRGGRYSKWLLFGLVIVFATKTSVFLVSQAIRILTLSHSVPDIYHWEYIGRWLTMNNFVVAGIVTFRFRRHLREPLLALLLFCLVPLYIYFLVDPIAVLIYGRVPEALGGGKPTTARLIFNKDGLNFWKQTGALPLQGPDSISSSPLQIVYQDDHQMAVITPCRDGTNRVIVLSKSLVDGFMQEDDRLLPPH